MKTKSFLTGLILLLSTLIFASCNPRENSSNFTSLTPTLESSTPIRLGFSNWLGYAPWQVAESQDFFAKNNVNVDLRFYDYLASTKAFAEGELDGNHQTLSDTITAIASGSSIDPVIILTTSISVGGDQIVVREGINTIADLKGKKIATETGSVDHLLLLLGLKKAGINPNEVQIENHDMRAAVAGFLEEQFDGVAGFIPLINESLKRSGSKILFSSQDFPGSITDYLVVDRQLMTEEPAALQGIVKTWFDTLDFIKQNPDIGYQIMSESMGVSVDEFKTSESGIQFLTPSESLQSFNPGNNLNSLPYAAQEISQFLLENQVITRQPDLSQLGDAQFIEAHLESR